MLNKGLFKKPENELEGLINTAKREAEVPEAISLVCPSCKKTQSSVELMSQANVCYACGYHFRTGARQRIGLIADAGTFMESDAALESANIIGFPDYDKKLDAARLDSNEKEAVICGVCQLGGIDAALFVMEPYFMMGSMGTVVGEKLTRLFEYALSNSLPVIGFTVSGGARMQEGIQSLMQMAKVSGAVKRHSDAGNLYITVLTDPTTGGVTASFAMDGDIIVAEPGALIGFAGPRVIEQTIRQKLPDGFQRAEFLLEKGFVDDIVDRRKQRAYLIKLLSLHRKAVD